MPGSFWTSIGGKLADRWATVSAGALVYWLGGLAAWLPGHGGFAALERPLDWLGERPAPVQVAVLAAALLAVAGSGILVQALTFPTIRAMEGYWPRRLRASLVGPVQKRLATDDRRLQELQAVRAPDDATREEIARIDRRLGRLPADPRLLMPTRVGNILRAAESDPHDKYGLDGVALWPHLWLVLPETARQEIAAARAALDSAARLFVWGLLFLPFATWSWPAAPVGLATAAAALWWRAPTAATGYAALIKAGYDLYRPALYRQLRWPLPANPRAERPEGLRLTKYLGRGLDSGTPTFTEEQ